MALQEKRSLVQFGLNRRLLRCVGLWPEERGSPWRPSRWPNALLQQGSLAAMVTSELAALRQYWGGELSHTTINACIILLVAVALCKASSLVSLRRPIIQLMHTLQDTSVPQNEWEERIYSGAARHARLLTLVLCVDYAIVAFIWDSLPLLNFMQQSPESRYNNSDAIFSQYPIIALYPWEVQTGPAYAFTYTLQVMCGAIFTMTHLACDTFLMSLVIYICSQIDVLRATLQQLGRRADRVGAAAAVAEAQADAELSVGRLGGGSDRGKALCGQGSEQELYQELVACIKHHKNIIGYVGVLHQVLSPVALAQFMCSMVIICLSGFGIAISNDFGALCRYCVYFTGAAIQLLIFCWYGEVLITKSERVSEAAMGCGWTEVRGRHFKSSALILMIRAQRPLALTGSKFYVISLKTFVQLLNASYSFFAVLRQLNESGHREEEGALASL
ncbi:odorant receptor 43a-like [Schistocerca gregaria]|uniref:odorant receptor 43a-like n=1 Tax=Schistocerca gregaria TaxID=7010 RepID=UPI00211EE211|nr:odorant receptor 43a-like [Schistocerca gregaria]